MEHKIAKQKSELLQPDVRNFYNGENGIQVAHADSFAPTIHIHLPNDAGIPTSLNREYYNLFIGYDPFEKDHILVTRDRALTEHMAEEVKALFRPKPEYIQQIKGLPTIISNERDRLHVDEQQGVLARITNVRFQQNGIVIYFKKLRPIPLMLLQNHILEFSLTSEWELNRTHWAIKNVDLVEVLQDIGIDVPGGMYGE